MQRRVYDSQRMATCMGLPRLMKKFRLIQKHKPTKRKQIAEPISLGSKIKYDVIFDQAWMERIIDTCGCIVTPVEGELTNEVLFQHAAEWSSALRAGLFPGKPPVFTALGKARPNKKVKQKKKGKQNQNKKNWPKSGEKSVVKTNAPYSVKHFVRKQALWLIQAHRARGTCRVDFSQMTVGDLSRLMTDTSNSLSEVGFSQQASVFEVAQGMDPLVTATLLCLFLPLQKKLSHLSAIMNPANHESALRFIQEYKSKAGVPPPQLVGQSVG